MAQQYDLIVVGLGAMGSAALYQAAKRGSKVLGIDRFAPPHEMGSSNAESRLTRLAVGEGPAYIPLVARSHEIWSELEVRSGQPLFYNCGGYVIAPGSGSQLEGQHWDNFVERTREIAEDHNIPHLVESPATVRETHPQFLLRDHEETIFELTGGVVLCEDAVDVQIRIAQELGARVHVNEPVIDIDHQASGVIVKTGKGWYSADKVIVSAGAWIKSFLPERTHENLKVTRQEVFWFEPEDPELFSMERCPTTIWIAERQEMFFSSFPMVPNGIPGTKVLTENFIDPVDAQTVNREITQADIDHFYETYVTQRIVGLTPNCVKAAVCLYTTTPDDQFLIDHHPDSDRVLIASPCSGHGFKHSAAIGEGLVEWALDGQPKLDFSPFRLDRFR